MKRTSALLLAAGFAAACADAPSGPVGPGPSPTTIAPAGAAAQSAEAGSLVAAAPAVIVRDGSGAPLAGTLVQFAVTRGGGTLGVSSARTDQDGYASAVEWRLGESAGENEATARVSGLEPVRFTATALAVTAPPASDYDIQVRFIGSATARQRDAVTKAVARWQTVIVGKLPSIRVTTAAGACFDRQPALDDVIDDLLIYVEFSDIDGVGKTLGEAGPCMIRSDSRLPIVGVLRLDNADLAPMERNGTLDDVVLHEIGHVLGIGTLWAAKQLLEGKGGDDPIFTGQRALQFYLGMEGVASAAGVPVENTGSTGTRDGHWRESVFGNELMTGYISNTPNPLSGLTVGSLSDLGYNTSTAGASTFTLGSASQSVVLGLVQPIDLRQHERILEPRFEIDRNGRTTPLRAVEPSGHPDHVHSLNH